MHDLPDKRLFRADGGLRHIVIMSLALVIIFILGILVLLSAMLLAANGWPGLVWGYAAYSALNAFAAWLILSGRA